MTDFQYTRHDDHIEITKYTGYASDVTIPSTIDGLPVTSIGDSAFSDSESLTSVTLPDSVTSIGDGTFSGCSSLTSVTLPDSVTYFGDHMFGCCTNLTIYGKAGSKAEWYAEKEGHKFQEIE